MNSQSRWPSRMRRNSASLPGQSQCAKVYGGLAGSHFADTHRRTVLSPPLLRLGRDFPLSFQLGVEEAMTGGFFPASLGMVVERRQPAVSREQSGSHAKSGFESQDGTLPVTEPRQGHTQVEVSKR